MKVYNSTCYNAQAVPDIGNGYIHGDTIGPRTIGHVSDNPGCMYSVLHYLATLLWGTFAAGTIGNGLWQI
jgi:hypothetical protein